MASRPARLWKTFSALGVIAAAVLAVNANVLAARRYERWDFTSSALYTLSQPTRETLRSLTEPVQVVVMLSRSDPLTVGVRHLLTAYGLETEMLQVRHVDPERSPAEFSAIQQKYGILAGKAEDGRVVTDASIVIARGDQHWFVTPEDMMRFDSDTGRVQPRLEQALTEGIVNVLTRDKPLVCFSRGHQELGLGDAGPDGLAELRDRIEKSNYSVAERDLPGTLADPFSDCRLLVIAGPKLSFGAAEAERIAGAIRSGMSALLLVGPILGEGGRPMSAGLEPVLKLADAALGQNLIVETDPEARLPRARGEVFFARPLTHDVTAGLSRADGGLSLRVLLSEAQSVQAQGQRARPLLASSQRAVALVDVRPLLEGRLEEAMRRAPESRHLLAVGAELEGPNGTAHAPRMVIVGNAGIAGGRTFREAALYGNRLFIENAISWLAARPALVSVPERAEHEIGLALTEEALGEVLRYVVVYMPASAALLGMLVLWRRRSTEKRGRKGDDREANDEARA